MAGGALRLYAVAAALTMIVVACSNDSGTTDTTETTQTTIGVSENPPLVSLEARTRGFTDFSTGTEKSFGIFVCVTDVDVVLESVEAISSDGEIEVLGGLLYEAEDGFVGAVNGFPPTGLDASFLTDIAGATVTTLCGADAQSQVVVGANRTGPGGGKIEGIRIHYEGGSLDVPDYNIILCGDEREFCEDVGSGGP